jgi:F subunit of K+-transporting ATPase (Potass_KdpF)
MTLQTLLESTSSSKRQLHRQINRHRRSLFLFASMCGNLLLAPAIYATNQGVISQGQSYAIGLLILTTFALSIYLFAVIFVPERF